jgi:hypothetical protein
VDRYSIEIIVKDRIRELQRAAEPRGMTPQMRRRLLPAWFSAAIGAGPPATSLAGAPVDRLPDKVGGAVVLRVLLDQVDEDPSQAGCLSAGPDAPGKPIQTAVGQATSSS